MKEAGWDNEMIRRVYRFDRRKGSMKLKEKLRDEFTNDYFSILWPGDQWQSEENVETVEAYEDGFIAGFEKARELYITRLKLGINAALNFTEMHGIGENLRRENQYLAEQLKGLLIIVENLGEEEV